MLVFDNETVDVAELVTVLDSVDVCDVVRVVECEMLAVDVADVDKDEVTVEVAVVVSVVRSHLRKLPSKNS